LARVSRTSPSRPGFGLTDLGLLLMATIWGINYSVVKFGTSHLSPLAYNGLRVALAALALWVIWAAVRGAARPDPATRRRLLLLGVLGNGLYQLCFIYGLGGTRVATASLIFASGPAFVALIGRARGVERIDRIGWLGIALQLVGVACVVISAGGDPARVDTVRGIGLVLLGAVAWALYTVLLKPLTATTHPIYLSAATMTSGAVLLGALALPDLARLDWGAVPGTAWLAVGYSGLAALVVAYLFWYRGIQRLGPTRTSMYGNLQPIVAFLVAWGMLGEVPTTWQVLGMVAILAGLAVSRRDRRANAVPLAPPTRAIDAA
jgi:drug/metabolite transporter (DMT)-like permease